MPVPDNSGWGVIVQVEEEKAFYTAIDLRRKSIALVAIVTGLAAVLGSLFAGQISRPIRGLAEGARRLAGGDYGHRVDVRSGNEVGILADAFNQMGEEIQKAIEQMRSARPRPTRSSSWARSACSPTPSTRRTRTPGATPSGWRTSRMLIAKHLGMSPEEVERVHLSGIIHDVGKIGIEDKILRKPAALTDEEYEMMKQHPTKGEHILEAVPLLKEMAGDGLQAPRERRTAAATRRASRERRSRCSAGSSAWPTPSTR